MLFCKIEPSLIFVFQQFSLLRDSNDGICIVIEMAYSIFFYLPSFASKMSFFLQRKYSVELLLYRNQMYTISVSNVSLNGYSIFPFSFRFRFRCCCFLMISLMAKITIAKWCDGIHLNEMTIKIDSNKNNNTNFFRWVVSVIAHTRRDSTNKPQKLCNWSTWMNFGNIFCGGGLQPYYNQ